MVLSPADSLGQFALSVDTIDSDAYEKVLSLVSDYFTNVLGASFYAVRLDGVRVVSGDERHPGLKTAWSSIDSDDAITVFDADDQYTGHIAYAYHRDQPLWITAPGGERLRDHRDDCIESWSGVAELPPYRDYGGGTDERTSIVLPLKYGGRVFGVADLEFIEHHECSAEARAELDIMFGALARVFWIHQTTANALRDTDRAVARMAEQFATAISPLERSTFFVASASSADAVVVDTMIAALRGHADRFDLVFWEEMTESGNINQQVAEAIMRCHLGVCYLSHRADGTGPDDGPPDGPPRFADNPNVLFEAGMLYALKQSPFSAPVSWIVVREDETLSERAPFDLAAERMLIVPRDETGAVDVERFTELFTDSVNAALGPS